MIISLAATVTRRVFAEGYVVQRNHWESHTPKSSLQHLEFTDHAYTCVCTIHPGVAFHSPLKGLVSVALVRARSCRIYTARVDVIH